jgi:hypothetical protein
MMSFFSCSEVCKPKPEQIHRKVEAIPAYKKHQEAAAERKEPFSKQTYKKHNGAAERTQPKALASATKQKIPPLDSVKESVESGILKNSFSERRTSIRSLSETLAEVEATKASVPEKDNMPLTPSTTASSARRNPKTLESVTAAVEQAEVLVPEKESVPTAVSNQNKSEEAPPQSVREKKSEEAPPQSVREQFTVKIVKPPGEKLGLKLVHYEYDLQIEAINAGVVRDVYNKSAPTDQVIMVGDFITKVGDIRGTESELYERLLAAGNEILLEITPMAFLSE